MKAYKLSHAYWPKHNKCTEPGLFSQCMAPPSKNHAFALMSIWVGQLFWHGASTHLKQRYLFKARVIIGRNYVRLHTNIYTGELRLQHENTSASFTAACSLSVVCFTSRKSLNKEALWEFEKKDRVRFSFKKIITTMTWIQKKWQGKNKKKNLRPTFRFQ